MLERIFAQSLPYVGVFLVALVIPGSLSADGVKLGKRFNSDFRRGVYRHGAWNIMPDESCKLESQL